MAQTRDESGSVDNARSGSATFETYHVAGLSGFGQLWTSRLDTSGFEV